MDNTDTSTKTRERFEFMILTIRNLNNSLILNCEHENKNSGIQDKVTNFYSRLFIIVNTLLQGDDYNVPSLPNSEQPCEEWDFKNFLALGLSMNLVLMSQMNKYFDPRKMCGRCYDDTLDYWSVEVDRRGINIKVKRIYVPVPYFNEINELVMMFKNTTVIEEDDEN